MARVHRSERAYLLVSTAAIDTSGRGTLLSALENRGFPLFLSPRDPEELA